MIRFFISLESTTKCLIYCRSGGRRDSISIQDSHFVIHFLSEALVFRSSADDKKDFAVDGPNDDNETVSNDER